MPELRQIYALLDKAQHNVANLIKKRHKMTPKPLNLPKEEMLNKYHETQIEARLELFDLTVNERVYDESPSSKALITRVRTETFCDKSTGDIVLTRHYISKGDGTITFTVSYLVENGIHYQAFRNL
jgi:hypothetical protein